LQAVINCSARNSRSSITRFGRYLAWSYRAAFAPMLRARVAPAEEASTIHAGSERVPATEG
jgi:hypothetical protein